MVCAVWALGDNKGVNPERAETHLRLLAEAELRRAAAAAATSTRRPPGDRLPGGGLASARLQRVTSALIGVGALDADTADSILAGFDLAMAVRDASPRRPPLAMVPPVVRRRIARLAQSSTRRAAPRPAPGADDRVVPVGMMIPVQHDDTRGELYLLAFSQTGSGARFSAYARLRGTSALGATGYPAGGQLLNRLVATDEAGTRYVLSFTGSGLAGWVGALELRPDPPPGVRWLDLTAPGAAERRISLGSPPYGPAVTVTELSRSPGEYLLDRYAVRILIGAAGGPHAPRWDGTAWLGDVVEALYAAAALSPLSPVPGQLATLCESLDLRSHGITAAPAPQLPKPWHGLLTHAYRRKPDVPQPPDGCACVAATLPVLDGVAIAIMGLHGDERGTMLHLHVSGQPAAPGPDESVLPMLWLRDDTSRWHATTQLASAPVNDGITTLRVVPPLPATSSVEVLAAGRSAEVRTTLPVRWR